MSPTRYAAVCRLLLLFLLLCGSALLLSCAARSAGGSASSAQVDSMEPAPAAEASASGAESTAARPLTLFRVSREGLADSYLFGTCHAGVSVEEALPAEAGALLTGASNFVMEVDPATMDPAMIQSRLMLADGQRLSKLMPEGAWPALVERFELGEAAQAFDAMHPFALLGFLTTNLANQLAGRGNAVPMDFTLGEMAAGAGVTMGYLETVAEQLDVFLGMSMETLIDELAALGDDQSYAAMKADLEAALELCRSGDESGLAAVWAKQENPDWERRLLDERNQRWMPKLEVFFAQGSSFVAVGAAHLFGDSGLPTLLQAQGYQVERLSGVTSPPSAPVEAPQGDGMTIPLSFLVDQVEAQASATLCGPQMVPVQCHGVTPEKCRGDLREAVLLCAEEKGIPAQLSADVLMDSVGQLGPCVVPRFMDLLPAEQEPQTAACKAAYEDR